MPTGVPETSAIRHRGIAPETWAAIGVFALGAACYANTVHGDFVFDDIKLIVNNDIVKDPRRVSELFSTNLWGLLGHLSNCYRPLPPLLFMLLHAVFGMRPEPFHLLNIALHAAATSLVFMTSRALLTRANVDAGLALWASLAGAALFAVHPIHTEAVAWMSGVMDVSCTAFSLLAIYSFVTADASTRPVARSVLSLFGLALALLSNELAAIVPFALVAYDLFFRRAPVRNTADALRRWGPSFGVLLGYLVLRIYVLGGMMPVSDAQAATGTELLLALPRLFTLYLQKLTWPAALNVVHDVKPVGVASSSEWLLAVLTIGAFAALGWLALRIGSAAVFGLVLFLLALAPSLYVLASSQDVSAAFAERYLYFPSVGAALAISAALATVLTLRRSRLVLFAAAGFVVVLFSVQTVSRNLVWKDGVSLWSDSVRKSPDVAVAHEGLGLALLRRGRECEGDRELQRALRLEPALPQRALESGLLAARKGLLLQAVLSFQTALRYRPTLVDAHYNQALALEQLGWTDAATQEYRTTLEHDPEHPDAHNNLGILLAQQDGLDEAIDHFKAAVRFRPSDPDLRLNLAHAYDAKGLGREAAEERRRARGIAKQ